MTKDELIGAIDSLSLHEKDYDVIIRLLQYGDDRLFAKILEEIISGNLYWSDFGEIFSQTDYPEYLSQALEEENSLGSSLSSLITLRKTLDDTYEYSQKSAGLCLTNDITENSNEYVRYTGNEAASKYNQLYTKSGEVYTLATSYDPTEVYYINISDKISRIYSEEYNKMRDSVLRSLTKPNQNDKILLRVMKNALYTYVKNGQYLLKNKDSASNITESTFDISENTYSFIDINTIFAFLKSYYIPIDYAHIILNDFDKTYMHENNLTEQEVKQIKFLYFFLRKNSSNILPDNEE